MPRSNVKYVYPALLLAVLLASISTYAAAVNARSNLTKVDSVLLEHLNGRSDSRLRTDRDSVYVFVGVRPGYEISGIRNLMTSSFAFGPQRSPSLVYGKIRVGSLLDLASGEAVSFVRPDLKLQYDRVKPDPGVYREGLATDMFRVRQIIGADRVNNLGISGDGVTIAIADTGTDFTIPDLKDAVARDSSGTSISFDPDGQSYVITELVVGLNGNALATKGKTVEVWNPASYVTTDPPTPAVVKVTIGTDYGAPSVKSKSSNYHFGILRETLQDNIAGETVTVDFPVVVIDANQAGIYDTVVVDMSTALYNFLTQYRSKLNSEASLGDSLGLGLAWPQSNASWNDHSFADETVHTANTQSDLIGLDITGDSVPDFSAGILAYGIDLGGRTGKYFSMLPPIDPAGNFINVFFDYESHGTSTASNAASRGVVSRAVYKNGTTYTLPGIAPKAKVMGVKVIWLGDVTFGWYYAAGFDWDPTSFTFKYAGKHRADIISNSWGVSNFVSFYGTTYGFDALSQLANALSLPRYLDPAYPGVTILVSAGNEGFGYGTVDTPSSASLAITVGASTNYAYRDQPNFKIANEIAGGFDEVVPWSSRGPTSLGEPKPDVVNVGAFGFADQSSYNGYGNGTKAYLVFGGTSMACPLTAGTAALVVEEYRKTHNGSSPSPDTVKALIASGATDLTYDVFTQGSGRVNAFDAVSAAAEGRDSNFPKRFYAYSTSTWENARSFLGGTWSLNLQGPIPNTPMVNTNWFAGIVTPGSTARTSLTLYDAGAVQAQGLAFRLIDVKRYSGKGAGSNDGWVSWITIPRMDIPAGTDLMKVTLVYRFTDFADTTKWDTKTILFASLYDTDLSKGAIRRMTNAAPYSTTSELVVSRPLEKFLGTPKARILNREGSAGIPFDLVLRFYKRAQWAWISQLATSPTGVNVQLKVPSDAQPGVYDGLILLTDGEYRTVVPVSVDVPILASGDFGEKAGGSPYDNYAVSGAFDWSGYYNAGDWRVFAVVMKDPAMKLSVKVSWSDSRTEIQSHLTGPSGYILASSDYPKTLYEGSGKFKWGTSTGGPADEIAVKETGPGIYFLVLHNTLLGASSFDNYPESFTLGIQFD